MEESKTIYIEPDPNFNCAKGKEVEEIYSEMAELEKNLADLAQASPNVT